MDKNKKKLLIKSFTSSALLCRWNTLFECSYNEYTLIGLQLKWCVLLCVVIRNGEYWISTKSELYYNYREEELEVKKMLWTEWRDGTRRIKTVFKNKYAVFVCV